MCLRTMNTSLKSCCVTDIPIGIMMSPYSEQSLSYWIVICFSQDIRHGFRQIDMQSIPYLSDYLFWKFTYLVMVITWWYLTIFVHQVCLFTFRHFGPNSGQCLLQENQKSYIQAGALFEIFRARGKKIIVLRQERHMPLNRSYLRLLL